MTAYVNTSYVIVRLMWRYTWQFLSFTIQNRPQIVDDVSIVSEIPAYNIPQT